MYRSSSWQHPGVANTGRRDLNERNPPGRAPQAVRGGTAASYPLRACPVCARGQGWPGPWAGSVRLSLCAAGLFGHINNFASHMGSQIPKCGTAESKLTHRKTPFQGSPSPEAESGGFRSHSAVVEWGDGWGCRCIPMPCLLHFRWKLRRSTTQLPFYVTSARTCLPQAPPSTFQGK